MGACRKKILSLTYMKNKNCSWDTAVPSAVLLGCGVTVIVWFGRALVYK